MSEKDRNQGVIIHFSDNDVQEMTNRFDAAIRAGGIQAAYALIPIDQKIRQAVVQSSVKNEV